MAARKATGNAEVIGDIVARVLQRAGLEQSLENNRILKLWASAVGPAVSRHASPRALHRGKLTVTVDSSSWHAELERYFKTKIIENLNRELGRPLIRSVVFRVGEVEAADDPEDGSAKNK